MSNFNYTKLLTLVDKIRKEAKADYLSIALRKSDTISVLMIISGLTGPQRSLLRAMNVTLEGQEFVLKKGTITDKVINGKKTQTSKSLYIQLDKLIPKNIASLLQKVTRIKEFVDVPIMKEGEVVGEAIYSFCSEYPASKIKKLEEITKKHSKSLLKFKPSSPKTSKSI